MTKKPFKLYVLSYTINHSFPQVYTSKLLTEVLDYTKELQRTAWSNFQCFCYVVITIDNCGVSIEPNKFENI